MKNIKMLVYMLVFVFSTDAVSAASPIYHLGNPYEASKGITLSSCDNTTGWVPWVGFPAHGSFTNDSVHTLDGTGSVKLTVDGNYSSGYYSRLNFIPVDLTYAENFAVDVWIDNASTVNKLYLWFESKGDDSTYYLVGIDSSYGTDAQGFQNGWNTFVLDKDKFITYNNETWGNITQLLVHVDPVANTTASVSFDRITYNYSGLPTVIFTFDDAYESTYTVAYPVMHYYNIPGVLYLITGRDVNATGNINVSEVDALAANGWDIASHTVNHAQLTTLTDTELDYQLSDSQNDLKKYGKSSLLISYPYGVYNDHVLSYVSKYYLIGRTTEPGDAEQHIQAQANTALHLKHYYVFNYTTPDQINRTIDYTIRQHGMCILTFHNISETSSDLYTYPVANFTKVCQYVASRNADISAVPLSSYIEDDSITGGAVISDTVHVTETGRSNIITYKNGMNSTYADLHVIPVGGSVDVTVSSWTDSNKTWVESSEIHTTKTQHIIGGFPADTPIQITRDNVNYTTVSSNSTGYINWKYNDGYGEHEFSAEPSEIVQEPSTSGNEGKKSPGFETVFGIVAFLLCFCIKESEGM